ncbi:XTP/dITP diphosphatase [Proteiniborus sp. MB09-C3]|uniref:XTP/dITP diphosphatase n=1 Tax=Proteiniborus sp. MB09-C3 TaxID=3050072 RepID=UPI0025526049|nr:XTP/dITP diphosphatase [Proteiniborus sp. MB09-C3]WIV11883.1 XTP/dITP diphosphatase [Proteiniborus sp. MB09-C3]
MSRKTLIVSSDNSHKIMEIRDILKDLPITVLSKTEAGYGDIEVIEDGDTLEENATKKAVEIAQKANAIVIADDTGLFVDKLNGEPGVYSARYSGENATYSSNNKKLLTKLEGVPLEERTAMFKTIIAIVLEDKNIKLTSGECSGKIGFEPRGEKGFGYDPLFIVDGYGKTFAELGEEIKNTISHRANALRNLKEELKKFLEDEGNENSSNK